MCNLSARLVRLRPRVYITFITVQNLYDRIEKELARNFSPEEEDLRDLIR